MKNLFYQPALAAGVLYLDPEESRHATKVLRKKAGDTIHVTDGKGALYICRITDPRPDKCAFVVDSTEREKEKTFRIHIAIAPTKNADRIEWFVEKAIEIGIDEISFVECDNSERTSIKLERIEKIAVSAMKQSLKFTLPKINSVRQLREFISGTGSGKNYIAYVDQNNPDELSKVAARNDHYTVLIGPEGDFSPAELELALKHGFIKVALGPSRLRTETAGMAACHTLNLINL
ncbi:MAG TPA: 16S rRNA (uracil(1498)-N(3))-methyltransferase [Cyclobacteriaceae bacterium]|nr:16S rRNA (uracil(1498)-N(3))-methyltransferase [Cyclobacteriaceae bacterium]HMV10738.1 16S rRNA (uracil(1498)-N(3))-methyltransferase [Cyclobacteriaceae bacterium]HMV90835.1 16S rRNA (uracil(1498)-N(3))-methyltransferase [Cyclobacteriaceae bacterium]HMX01680.1 16S rRNA (uracil(1498)-N(3))-methyltransferase [Cyclobacteriaceae bacterium]HMX51357.1 16S rRNA (uracil(1498)-N(3))-methyltransferase [Cyclobacteriaceae bacterium]